MIPSIIWFWQKNVLKWYNWKVHLKSFSFVFSSDFLLGWPSYLFTPEQPPTHRVSIKTASWELIFSNFILTQQIKYQKLGWPRHPRMLNFGIKVNAYIHIKEILFDLWSKTCIERKSFKIFKHYYVFLKSLGCFYPLRNDWNNFFPVFPFLETSLQIS